MKKVNTWLLGLLALLCLAGCGTGETGESGFLFTYNGCTIAMNGAAAPVIAALGEPESYTEAASCAFDGLDKTYGYGSFYMTTYPAGEQDYVYSVWFVDDGAATAEGIRIGDSRAEVEKAYGEKYFDGVNAFTMVKGGTKLTIILTNGAVSSIQYEAEPDDVKCRHHFGDGICFYLQASSRVITSRNRASVPG